MIFSAIFDPILLFLISSDPYGMRKEKLIAVYFVIDKKRKNKRNMIMDEFWLEFPKSHFATLSIKGWSR